jgi:hypothetical protein
MIMRALASLFIGFGVGAAITANLFNNGPFAVVGVLIALTAWVAWWFSPIENQQGKQPMQDTWPLTRALRRDFTHADLRTANLAGLDLTNTDFTRANLAGASLAGADLRGSTFGAANLTGADLRGAIMTADQRASAKLKGAIVDDEPKPKLTNPSMY